MDVDADADSAEFANVERPGHIDFIELHVLSDSDKTGSTVFGTDDTVGDGDDGTDNDGNFFLGVDGNTPNFLGEYFSEPSGPTF